MVKALYFKHDFFARTDIKMQNLLMEHGASGIGIYWCIIEQLYESGGYLPLDFSKGCAFALHVEKEQVDSIIRDFGLFQYDEEQFWSVSALERIAERNEEAEKRSNAGRKGNAKRWNKVESEDGIIAMLSQPNRNAIATQSQCDNNSNRNAITMPRYKDKDKDKDKYNIASTIVDVSKSLLTPSEDIDFSAFQAWWNNQVSGSAIRSITKITAKRKAAIKARVKEYGKEAIETMLCNAINSTFLAEAGKGCFDWLMRPNNFPKVLEGNYNDKHKTVKRDSSAEREAERTRRERAYDENAALSITPSQYKALLARAKQGDADALHALQLTPEQVANLAN